jgi:hypothetical protein
MRCLGSERHMFVSNIAEDQAACSARSNSHAESARITYVFKASTFATHLSTDVLRRGRGLPLIHLRVDFTESCCIVGAL